MRNWRPVATQGAKNTSRGQEEDDSGPDRESIEEDDEEEIV